LRSPRWAWRCSCSTGASRLIERFSKFLWVGVMLTIPLG
jgi:hypothetical protein